MKEGCHFISHRDNPAKERAIRLDVSEGEGDSELEQELEEEDQPKVPSQQPFGASISNVQSEPPLQDILSSRHDYIATSIDDLRAA